MLVHVLLLAACFVVAAPSAAGMPPGLSLAAAVSDHAAEPRQGSTLRFYSVIRNQEQGPIESVIAWLSLIQTDTGKKPPVDLEAGSGHKALTVSSLRPARSVATGRPIRLTRPDHYRVLAVMVGTSSHGSGDFGMHDKMVVGSAARVLPVAGGVPLLLAGLLVWLRRGRHS
jgi:hypothetical protein